MVGVWICVYVRGLKDHKFVLSMHFKNYSKIESTRHLKPGKDFAPTMLSQSELSRFVNICQYIHQSFRWETAHILTFSFQSRGPSNPHRKNNHLLLFLFASKQKNTKLYLALVVILQCLDGFSMKQNVMGYLQVYSTIRNTKHILNYYNFLGPLLKMMWLLITQASAVPVNNCKIFSFNSKETK